MVHNGYLGDEKPKTALRSRKSDIYFHTVNSWRDLLIAQYVVLYPDMAGRGGTHWSITPDLRDCPQDQMEVDTKFGSESPKCHDLERCAKSIS